MNLPLIMQTVNDLGIIQVQYVDLEKTGFYKSKAKSLQITTQKYDPKIDSLLVNLIDPDTYKQEFNEDGTSSWNFLVE